MARLRLLTTESPAGVLSSAVRYIGQTGPDRGWCIVVPRAHLKRDVTSRLMEGHGGDAWIGIRTLTLSELIQHYARRLEGQPALTDLQVRQLITASVREVRDEDPDAFPDQIRDGRVSEATLRSLTHLFAELEPFGLTAEELEERLLTGPLSENVSRRARDVTRVYRRHLDRIHASDYRGPQEEAVRATHRAADAAPPPGVRRFLFLGLDGVGVANIGVQLFYALGNNDAVEESALAMVLPDDIEESAWSEHGNLPLFRQWTETGRPYEPLTETTALPDLPADLEALARDPFAYRKERVGTTGAVRGVRVPDTQLEVEWTCADIKRRVLDGEVEPHEVAVIARNMDVRARDFERELDRLGLPSVASREETIGRVPAVRALLSVFRISARDWPVSEVVSVAESPYLRLGLNPTILARVGGRGTRPRGPEDWLRRIRQYGKAAAREQESSLASATREAERLEENFRTFVEQVRRLTGDGESSIPPSRWAEALVEAVELWDLEEEIYSASELIDRRERGELARMDLDGVNALLTAADEWLRGREVAGLGDDPMDAATWQAELDSMAAETTIRASTYPRQAVQLLGARQAALRSWRAVYVVGLTDGQFPAHHDPDGHTLNDTERRALHLPTTTQRTSRERLYFHLAAAAARETLTLVVPAADERGKALVTSSFVSSLPLRLAGFEIEEITARQMVPAREEEVLSGRDLDLLAADSYREITEIAEGDPAHLRELLADDPLTSAWLTRPSADRALRGWRVARTRDELEGFLLAHPDGARRPPRGEYAGLLRPEDVPEEIRSDDFAVSPTELDIYGRGHFRFWASRVLGLWAGPDREADHNEAAAFGSLQHAILEDLYGELDRRGTVPPRSEDDIDEALGLLRNIALAHVRERMASAHERLWDLDLDFVLDVLTGFVRRDLTAMLEAERDPRSTRIRTRILALEEYVEGVPLEVDGVPFRLRGRIDRVEEIVDDRLPEAARGMLIVRDYKSSRSEWSPGVEQYREGKYLQLPLYATLAEKHFGRKVFGFGELRTSLDGDPPLVAVRDVVARGAGIELLPVDGAHENPVYDARKGALREAARRVKQMRQGRFEPQPDRSCWGCPFADVCRAAKLSNPASMRQRAQMPMAVSREAIDAASRELSGACPEAPEKPSARRLPVS